MLKAITYPTTASQVNDATGIRLGAIGGLAYLSGGVFPARQIAGSFAVAQVGDQEGVDVYYENRYFGKTDSNGQILIPNLRPYEANKISIDPADLPIFAEVQELHREVSPGFRQGLVVDFPINTTRPVILSLSTEDGAPFALGVLQHQVGSQDRCRAGPCCRRRRSFRRDARSGR